jgi:hypothetical protein
MTYTPEEEILLDTFYPEEESAPKAPSSFQVVKGPSMDPVPQKDVLLPESVPEPKGTTVKYLRWGIAAALIVSLYPFESEDIKEILNSKHGLTVRVLMILILTFVN